MLQRTFRCLLSRGNYSHSNSFGTYSVKQSHRQSKGAKFEARLRAQQQQQRFECQQQINQNFGEAQRMHAHSRKQLERDAYGLLASTSRKGLSAASTVRVDPHAKAEKLATARHLLMLQEATRREMKRGKTRRAESFRSAKGW